jgi:hypothetical protein
MSLLASLKTDDNVQQETDSVGGGYILESGMYPLTVTMAYLQKSAGGALGLFLHFKSDDGKELRETLWVTSGDTKGNKPYYENRQGEKAYLPGFNMANSLCLLTVGKELGELTPEDKVIKVYSPEAKAEVPTQVPVLMELLNQRVLGAVMKQLVDKQAKGSDGAYHPTGETRESNEIDKFFREKDQLTTSEIRAGATEPGFIKTWKEKWAGVTRDKTDKNAVKAAGIAGAPKVSPLFGGGAAITTQKPTQSLFG